MLPDDLNLRSEYGATELRRRVDQAVLTLSDDASLTTGTMLPRPDVQRARDDARRSADEIILASRR